MHWSLRMIIDLPKAILTFRKSHIMMSKIQKVEKKEGSIAGFKTMLTYPSFEGAEVEIYMDMLPEVMDNKEKYSSKEIKWFLARGEEYGILKRVDTPVEPDDSWRKWEEE